MVRTYAVNPSTSTSIQFHDPGHTPRNNSILRRRLSSQNVLPNFYRDFTRGPTFDIAQPYRDFDRSAQFSPNNDRGNRQHHPLLYQPLYYPEDQGELLQEERPNDQVLVLAQGGYPKPRSNSVPNVRNRSKTRIPSDYLRDPDLSYNDSSLSISMSSEELERSLTQYRRDVSAANNSGRRPLSFNETALVTKPVFAGNQTNAQSELDRNLREADRQRKLQYQADLKRQIEEQAAMRSPRNQGNRAAQRNAPNEKDIDRQIKEQQKQSQLEYNRSLQRQIEEQKMLRESQNYGGGRGAHHQTPDVDRQLKETERARKMQYQRELQNQIAEQKMKQAQQELEYGGDGLRLAMKAQQSVGAFGAGTGQNQSQPDDPPWLRGNPQPKNGLRGANSPFQSQGLQRQKSMPFDYRYSQDPYATPGQVPAAGSGFNYVSPFSVGGGPVSPYAGISSGFGSSSHSPLVSAVAHQQQANSRSDQQRQLQEQQFLQQRQKLEQDRQNNKLKQEVDYDPFGKGGGGAPVRDRDGKVITDRRRLRKSWSSLQDTNLPHDYDGARISPSNSMNAGINKTGFASDPFAQSGFNSGGTYGGGFASSFNPAVSTGRAHSPHHGVIAPVVQNHDMTEKERHMAELKQQIEDKKRQQAMEAEKERQEDEKIKQRIERDNAKIQAEIEEEQRKHKEKIAAHAKKQAELEEVVRKKAEADLAARKPANRRSQPVANGLKPAEEENDGLEWWEKNQPKRAASRQSRQLNASRNSSRQPTPAPSDGGHRGVVRTPPPEATYDSSQTLQKEEISQSPPVTVRRRSVRPVQSDNEEELANGKEIKTRPAMVRNEGVMRQLSAMRERLTKEQIRVKSALRRKEYDLEIFSDDDIPLDSLIGKNGHGELDDVPSFAKKSKNKKKPYSDLFSDDENDRPSKSRQSKITRSRLSGLLFSDDDDDDEELAKSRQKPKRRNTLGGGHADSDDGMPLVSLIKNSRTLLDSSDPDRKKVSSRRSEGGGRKMNGFLDSSSDDDDFPSMTKGKKKGRGASRLSDFGDFPKIGGNSSSSRRIDSAF